MSDYLPHEIIIEILTKLPVKSILRCILVCKAWHSLITSPNFIVTHLNRTILNSKIDHPTLFIRHYDKNDHNEHYTLHREDETFGVSFSELEFPFKSPIGYFRIVGGCNGLICLSDDLFGDMETIILWNPSIRKSVTLPKPSKPKSPHMFVLGFGVDPMTQDFKVVRIVYYKGFFNGYEAPPDVEIYTLSTGSWRSINSAAPSYCMVEFMWSQALVNGVVHWIANNRRFEFRFRSLIVSFDLGEEVFDEIVLPDALAGEIATNLSISVFRESLAVIEYDKEIGTMSCCVWVMKEYGVAESWTRLFNIDLEGTLEKIIGFRKNGEVLLSPRSCKLVAYDPKTGLIKDLEILGNTRSFHVDTYMETLVLLQEIVPQMGN
ncbi:unnamed protein product [Ilex paraguariensis]|uniref:F-box domain-containing protein n=1 Tax=Ilex paraguariensis TaxID=185542 RepID=A0ABC8SP24_9AQUA